MGPNWQQQQRMQQQRQRQQQQMQRQQQQMREQMERMRQQQEKFREQQKMGAWVQQQQNKNQQLKGQVMENDQQTNLDPTLNRIKTPDKMQAKKGGCAQIVSFLVIIALSVMVLMFVL